jgi:hypothetical protein
LKLTDLLQLVRANILKEYDLKETPCWQISQPPVELELQAMEQIKTKEIHPPSKNKRFQLPVIQSRQDKSSKLQTIPNFSLYLINMYLNQEK